MLLAPPFSSRQGFLAGGLPICTLAVSEETGQFLVVEQADTEGGCQHTLPSASRKMLAPHWPADRCG